jgi:HEPN domain-containing protein
MTKPLTKIQGAHPEALFAYARQYHRAATALLPNFKDVEEPLYFLHAHTIELALKAFLRSRDRPLFEKHGLGTLLDNSEKHGLHVDMDLRNVVELLEVENKRHGYRYFVAGITSRPGMDYVPGVVDALMRAVEKHLESSICSSLPGRGAVRMTFGKPKKKP